MEPLTLFASTVGLIGAFHLLSTTAQRFGKGIYDQGNQQAKREDWYCFFQPADLLGTDAAEQTISRQPTIVEGRQIEQRRRQQASRPRLQA